MNNCTQSFTPREMEVALLVRQGYSDMQIASELGLSYNTIYNYIRIVRAKTATVGKNRVCLSNAISAVL